MAIAIREGFTSVAFPLIGAGTGGRNPLQVRELMVAELAQIPFDGEVRVVVLSDGAKASSTVVHDDA